MQRNCETCWFVLGIHCSTGFEMKTFAYTLNSFPVFLAEGQAVWLFSLLSASPILYLSLPHQPSNLLSSTPPLVLNISPTIFKIFYYLHFFFPFLPFLKQIYQAWHWERKKIGPPLPLMSNACSCVSSADGCQTLQSQTLCSAGVFLWSLLTNSNGLFLSGGEDLG